MTVLTHRGIPFRVQTQAPLPALLRVQGITLGATIRLTGSAQDVTPELLAHEFCHVMQWRDLGTLTFVWRYLRGLLLYGYGLRHPMEREAYDYAVRSASDFVSLVGALSRVA